MESTLAYLSVRDKVALLNEYLEMILWDNGGHD